MVGAITPWNYPLHQIICKLGGALAAGCTFVLKPSEVAPLNAFILAEIVHEIGLPAGVFNLVTGTGPVVGAAISGSVAILLALVALGPVQALIMLGVVVAVQQLESHILQPLLIGRAMKIHPLAVIFAIAAGLILAGIIGGLIAVPTVAVLNAVGHHLLDSADEAEEPEPDPTEPTTAEDLLDPQEEAQARDEADAVEEQAEAASRERLEPGHS